MSPLSDSLQLVPGYVTLVVLIIGTIAGGWAIFRAQALSAWRAAAEGYKAQVEEMKPRLSRAEDLAVSLQAQITELEQRPDLARIMEAVGTLDLNLRRGLTDLQDELSVIRAHVESAPNDP